MPRERKKEHRGLPKRWIHQHGAYYFQVPVGQESAWDGRRLFRLGATLPEAYKTWSVRLVTLDQARSIGELLDRYALQVVPTKAAKTQTENNRHIVKLRAVFGQMSLTSIRPQMIYQYIDKRGAKVAAEREIEVLSHAFTKAIEWGYVDRHPFKGQIRMQGNAPRSRYVEDWEVQECLALDSKRKKGSVGMIQAYMQLKLMTGMARSDLLRLTMTHLKDDGIHIQRHKTKDSTGKRTIYEWTPELKAAVQQAKDYRPVLSAFLFCTRTGAGYIDEAKGTANGWDSMWQRFMDRVLKETKVTERFTEHDLRAKVASDADSVDRARALLSHADQKTTEAIYRRKPERVKPLV